MTRNTIIIENEEIPVEEKKLDVFELKYYPENPRIASIIDKFPGKITDDFLDKKMWEKNETHQLLGRIRQHGGLINPIIVHNGFVIEGNTRLCCFRHLYEETKEDKWKLIPSRVLLSEIGKRQVNSLLGNEHIIGKIEWDTYEKAHWITTMLERDKYDIEDVKKITGKSELWIKNMMKSYKTMVEEKVGDSKKFSHFMQLYSNNDIRMIKEKIPDIEEKCIEAIKNEQFEEARDLRLVPDICKDKKATNDLFEGGETAKEVLDSLKGRHPTIDSPLIDTAEKLTRKLQKMKREDRDEIARDKRQVDKIKRLTEECIKFCQEMKLKVHVPKEMKQ